jgi:hypothetical protein
VLVHDEACHCPPKKPPNRLEMASMLPHAVEPIDRTISLYDFGIAIDVDLDRAKIEPELIDIHLEPCELMTLILND